MCSYFTKSSNWLQPRPPDKVRIRGQIADGSWLMVKGSKELLMFRGYEP